MFARFTERARRVITRAGDDADRAADTGATLVLSASDVEASLDPAAAVAIVADTLGAVARGVVAPAPRSTVEVDDGAFVALPGHLRPVGLTGLKWICSLAGNPSRNLPKVRGAILLSEASTGALVAVLDAKAITAVRTGALAAIAAQHCGRPGAAVAAIVGFGAVGQGALEALRHVMALEEVRVYARRRDVLEDDAARAAASARARVVPAPSVRDAVSGADVVITATGLTEDAPVVERSWVRAGAVVCGLGSYQEVTDDLVHRADLRVVDDPAAAESRGQFAPLVRAGRLGRADIHAELSEIVAGTKPGRRSPDDVVVASLLGRGVLDLAVAADVLRRAQRLGLGRCVAMDA